MSRRSRILLLCMMSLAAFPTCGKKNSLSEGIEVSLEPSSSYILPGSTSSCKDLKVYTDAVDAEELGQSVQENRVNYPSFRLKWTKDDQLTVALIKFSIRHPSIEGGYYECKLSGDDLSALLGAYQGRINGKDDEVLGPDNMLDSSGPDRAIDPNDPPEFPACGFDCGSISLKEGVGNFRARAKLEVVGYSFNTTTKEQRPVKVTINPSVEYFR